MKKDMVKTHVKNGGVSVKTNYKLRGNEKLYIIPLSDLHIGSEQFNEEYFQYALDTIDNIQQDKRIYLCGDLLESASKHVGNSSFKTEMTMDDQLDYAIKVLKPFKKDIVFSAIGNHEARLNNEFDLNVNRIISRALHIDEGNQVLDRLMINGRPFTIYAAHGKGSSAHHHTAQSKMIRDTQHIDADMFLHGHNHRCDHFTIPGIRMGPDGKEIYRRHYVFTGSFLRYNGYAEAMQLPVLPEAFIQLSINQLHRVRSTQFNIDETKPEYMIL